MVPGGLGLVIFTFGLIAAMIVCNKWIRKVTNSYFFWLVIGAFWFVWLIVFRFSYQWSDYIAQAKLGFDDPGSIEQSYIISKAYLLDVCPFVALAMCFALIVDPTRKFARTLAPMAIIGGAITVISMSFDTDTNASWTIEFIFFGSDPNYCYFIMHFLQVVLGVGVLLNTPSGGWKNWLATLLVTLAFYGYVAIVMAATGCRWNTSGLSINDWLEDGEYHFVSKLFGMPPRVCQCVGIPLLFGVGCGICAVKDYVFNKGHFSYGNAFSGKWYAWYNYNKFVKIRFL